MARAGMIRWRSRNCAPANDGCDEVQKSLDLLDRVLSEFDDFENGSPETDRSQLISIDETVPEEEIISLENCETPEDESLSGLGGHQSEDDGYMSMNGRKAKLLLTNNNSTLSSKLTNSENEVVSTLNKTLPLSHEQQLKKMRQNYADFPPPPEEAERIISTLLPRVSPCNSSQRNRCKSSKDILNSVSYSLEKNVKMNPFERRVTIATQTTLPKTKHQRPYGWQKETHQQCVHKRICVSSGAGVPKSCSKYGSLPYDGIQFDDSHSSLPWLQRLKGLVPPRTVPTVLDWHREVRRCAEIEEATLLKTVRETTDDDPANFSDDSLEEMSPLPPLPASPDPLLQEQKDDLATSKRSSVAWEVPLDAEIKTPTAASCMKLVEHKSQMSTDYSCTSSLNALNVYDDGPESQNSVSDSLSCLTSVTETDNMKQDYSVLESRKLNFHSGTYVIRRGNKKDRVHLKELKTPPIDSCANRSPVYCHKDTDLKRCSSTFDNIKILLKEGLVEGLDDSPPDFLPPRPPFLARGVSLPNIINESIYEEESKTSFGKHSGTEIENSTKQLFVGENACMAESDYLLKNIWTDFAVNNFIEKQSVAVQVSADFTQLNKEVAEQSISCQTDHDELNYCVNKVMSTTENITSCRLFERESNELLINNDETTDKNDAETELVTRVQERSNCGRTEKKRELRLEIVQQDIASETKTSDSELPEMIQKAQEISAPVTDVCDGVMKPASCGDFRVNVEILQHEFGPLPPSPVEEVDDEFADILHSVPTNKKADSLSNDSACRRNSRIGISGPVRSSRVPDVPPHREHSSNLKTRSVDAGFTRNYKTQFSSSRKEAPVERRTLPTDLPGTHRRPFQKRGSQSPKDDNVHVSCSLPETPIFARGCDIPRTPLRNNSSDKANSSRTTSRLNGIQTSGYLRTVSTGHGTCLGDAMAGAELLRLTGPGRGWYPRHRQPRPASVEHLDRLTPQGLSPNAPTGGTWEGREAGKPLTLPPNLSPKFFQRSPREALRRVTSLLIRKGVGTKDTKSKDVLASSVIGPHGDFGETSRQQKRGFFRSFWKRSRHYSLDQQ